MKYILKVNPEKLGEYPTVKTGFDSDINKVQFGASRSWIMAPVKLYVSDKQVGKKQAIVVTPYIDEAMYFTSKGEAEKHIPVNETDYFVVINKPTI